MIQSEIFKLTQNDVNVHINFLFLTPPEKKKKEMGKKNMIKLNDAKSKMQEHRFENQSNYVEHFFISFSELFEF